jgi:hypothetical protein
MRPAIASFAILVCLITPALAPTAEEPQPVEARIVLSGPESSVKIGELVRLNVADSNAASFKWLLFPESSRVDLEVYDSGRRATFSARVGGKYQFIIAAAKGDSVDVISYNVTVIGPPKEPTDDSISTWIPYWVATYNLPNEEKLKVAAAFESVAARSYELPDANAWIKATADANNNALGVRVEAWKPFLLKIGEKVRDLALAGEISTPEDHARVWIQIAKALRSC